MQNSYLLHDELYSMKRLFDLTVALFVGILSMPLVLVAAAVIYLGDRKNPIFSQKRLGKNKKVFTLYKLRTMHIGTPSTMSHNLNSSSVTTAGAFLRKTKLDELPQLLNVIRGDMSLVGPRPGLETDLKLTDAREKLNIFSILPGVTGISQINNIDMSDPNKLASSDKTYLEKQSFILDLRIIIKTVLGRGQGDKIRK